MASCCLTSLDRERKDPWIPLLRLWECLVFFPDFILQVSSAATTSLCRFIAPVVSYCPSCAICYQLWLWLFKANLFLGTINKQYYLVILSLSSCLCRRKYWWAGPGLNFLLVLGWALDREGPKAGFLWIMFTSTLENYFYNWCKTVLSIKSSSLPFHVLCNYYNVQPFLKWVQAAYLCENSGAKKRKRCGSASWCGSLHRLMNARADGIRTHGWGQGEWIPD